jgi:signal transduction histidine kinase
VTVALSAEAQQALITVSDQGPGIEPDQMSRIFDRLYSRQRREGEQAGSGLGLAIARAIAHDHGGELIARNSPEQGAAFTLTLPLPQSSPATPDHERNPGGAQALSVG